MSRRSGTSSACVRISCWPGLRLTFGWLPLVAAVECEREEVMVRSTPSFRTARHYGSFLLIFVSGAAYLKSCMPLAAHDIQCNQASLTRLLLLLQIMAMSYAVIGPLILPMAVVFFCTSLVRMHAACRVSA